MQTRLIIVYFFLLSFSASGQLLRAEIDHVYNFTPGTLSRTDQEKKAPQIDALWSKIKGDTATWLPLLRRELDTIAHRSYFYYDGAALLLSLSESNADKELAANAIAKCDIADIEPRIYVTLLNRLAADSINVTNAAIKILDDPDYSFILPRHGMNFHQGHCLAYMLLPLAPDLYTDTLIAIFPTLPPASQISVITLFWLAYSCKGDLLINACMNAGRSVNKQVKEYARNIMKHTELTKDQEQTSRLTHEQELDTLRKQLLQRFSDEALNELELSTRILRRFYLCR